MLAAELDKYVSIARRSNDSWYIGTVSNNDSRSIRLNFKFLPEGKYRAEIYSDAADAAVNADNLTKQAKIVDKSTTLELSLAPGGGNLIILNKL